MSTCDRVKVGLVLKLILRSLFSNDVLPDPVDISLEYLDICRLYPGVATLKTIQTHIRHFIDFQW